MLRLCFLIRSLHPGGAERQLVELVTRLDPSRFTTSVLTFYSGGQLECDLAGTSVELVPLAKQGRWDLAGFLRRASAAVKARHPDIVHGYLGVANELALVLGRRTGARVVWGIRSSQVDFSEYDWSHAASFRASAALSRLVDLVIYNSEAGARHHRAHGYRPRREAIIPNGVDIARFRRDLEGRHRVRQEWGVQPGDHLVGLVGRVDPIKDTALFLRAALHLNNRGPGWRFVCVGDATSAYAEAVRRSPEALSLGHSLVWAGVRQDLPAVYSALDTLVLSSRGEGFPNAVVEAMACETPCVATDVGDARSMIGPTGWVVPVGDAAAISAACWAVTDQPESERVARGRQARQRVADHFTGARLADATAARLEEIAR